MFITSGRRITKGRNFQKNNDKSIRKCTPMIFLELGFLQILLIILHILLNDSHHVSLENLISDQFVIP